MIASSEASNFDIFQDCISTSIIEKLAPTDRSGGKKRGRRIKGRKNEIKPVVRTDEENEAEAARVAEELGDFVEYIAKEIFLSLPSDLRTLSYAALQSEPKLGTKYTSPLSPEDVEALTSLLDPSIAESLTAYTLLSHPSALPAFLSAPLSAYIQTTTLPPPPYVPSSRPSECEICDREHLPLTYHHLIPRQVQDKAVKRGWCEEWERNKVAWLCRACHSFVHGIAGNEELARDWNDVEVLMGREDVQAWAKWVGRVRWKKR